VFTAPHLTLDALDQHPAGSVLPRVTVGAPQGRRAAMLHGAAGVLPEGGAARLLGAVCAHQGAGVAIPHATVGVLLEGGAEIPRSAV
jgi:hypothetical protein